MAGKKVCILAVDDNPDNLMIIRALAADAFPGAAVLTAQTGREGIALAAEKDPDVVLLDIVMPGMDGFEVCRRLKADKTLRDIPIVFVTALREDKETRLKALECGAEAFLTKPVDETELTAQIRAMVKIKTANIEKRTEKMRLAEMVAKKTRQLKEEHEKTLRLLEELKNENESRKISEHALFEAQTLAHIGSFERSNTDDTINWTKECLRIFGVKIEEDVNNFEKSLAFIHPDDREAFLRKRRQAMTRNKTIQLEFRIVRPDGSVRHVDFRFIPVFENGVYVRGHGTVQDVTERVEAEEALKQSEDKFRRIAENISDVVWTANMDLETTYVSPSVQKLLGEPPEVHMKRTLRERIPPTSLAGVRALFEEEMQKEKNPHADKKRSRVIELEHYRADGSIIWISMHVSMLRDERGRPTGFMGVTRNISEIKRAEEALRRSEERFRMLFDKAPLGYQSVAPDGSLLDVNQQWLDMTGYSREEALGRRFHEFLSPKSKERYEHCFKNLMERGEIVTEFEVKKKDGDLLLADCVGKAAYDRYGNFMQTHCMLQDITLQRKAEAELDRQRGRAQQYLDIAGIIFLVLDSEAKVTLINQKGCEVLGLPREEIIGKKWIEHFIPESIKKNLSRVFADIEKGKHEKHSKYENPILTAGGEERLISWRNTVLRDADGNYEGVLSSGMDITEHDAALKALRESERSKSVLLSHIPGLAYRCMFDRKWTMTFLSDGCLTLTGYAPESLIGNRDLSFDDLICEEYRETVQKEWEKSLEQKTPYKFRHEIITASGERKWVLEMGQGVYGENGEVEALEGIVIDIDESKRRHDQIQYMNDHDFLTGIYNRKYFEEAKDRLEKEGCCPLSIIVADINGVRLINDAFGHAQGDRLIRETAKIIQGCCREGDIAARTEGDAFGVLLPNTGREGAVRMATKIREACEKYNAKIRKKADTINLSIGFGIKADGSASIDDVEKEAEEYLYNRKLLERGSHHSTILSSVMATMYARSQETEEHAERLARLSTLIGQKMKLSQKNLDELNLLAMLHDIGKIGIDDRILNKPGPLSEPEWIAMKKHPEIGYRIVMAAPELQSVAEYILSHHERWDGNGYPRGIAGNQIPLVARILAVADSYDAMTQDRVYRKALPRDAAVAEIRKNAGKQFDPEIAELFLKLAEKGDLV
jgi:diguanylate cyclase (GGDEF)-like protein/PAS domain S-box-containing protein